MDEGGEEDRNVKDNQLCENVSIEAKITTEILVRNTLRAIRNVILEMDVLTNQETT